ncbi:MAG: AAA family ATPase, partial [Oceanococcaceae bacterium]
MNSGDVVVAAIGDDLRMDYTAKGQTTALAARLEARARPGTILLSGFSARLLGSQFALESLKTVSVKGIDEPVPCYRLLAARESAHAPGSVDFFSGREAELEQLSEAARLAAQGPGRVVWVRGESGVGKNQLLRAFAEQLLEQEPERRILRFQGSSQSRAEPGIAIRRMLRAVLGLHEEAEASEIADVLPEFLQQFGVQASAEVEAMQQWLQSPRQSQIPEDLLSAVQRVGADLMRGGFAQEPLVFLLHDLAKLDNSIGRPMMQLLFHALAHTRWLILASLPVDWTNPWEEGPAELRIQLDPLRPEQVQSWLDQQLGTHASLEDFKKALVRASGGYPLHVQAVLDSLQERGLLEQRRRGWVLKRPLEELPLPEQIVAIWSARIDALAPARKSLLQTMAVIGEQVSLPLLQRVSGLPQASLRAELSALEECRLLQREAAKMWRFCQPAIRQVCYRGLLESQRQQWHGQVADAFDLEQAGPELLQEAAQHLRDAGRWEEALHVYLRLGDSCLLSDPALALQALEQAASVQQQGPALPRWVFYRQLWQLLHRPAELLEEPSEMCAEAQVLLAIQQLLQAERPAAMTESAAQDAPVWAGLHAALCHLAQGEVALALESLPATAACHAELQPWRDALGALLHALAGRPYTAWRQACDLRQRE